MDAAGSAQTPLSRLRLRLYSIVAGGQTETTSGLNRVSHLNGLFRWIGARSRAIQAIQAISCDLTRSRAITAILRRYVAFRRPEKR
eukprot:3399939-Prymnesium_polylepis.1